MGLPAKLMESARWPSPKLKMIFGLRPPLDVCPLKADAAVADAAMLAPRPKNSRLVCPSLLMIMLENNSLPGQAVVNVTSSRLRLRVK